LLCRIGSFRGLRTGISGQIGLTVKPVCHKGDSIRIAQDKQAASLRQVTLSSARARHVPVYRCPVNPALHVAFLRRPNEFGHVQQGISEQPADVSALAGFALCCIQISRTAVHRRRVSASLFEVGIATASRRSARYDVLSASSRASFR